MSGAKRVQRLIENHARTLRIERRRGAERLRLLGERGRLGLRLGLELGGDRLGLGL
jgi:hypothetical protein